eukprot:1461793-Pyramimonas_sp.AAC.1
MEDNTRGMWKFVPATGTSSLEHPTNYAEAGIGLLDLQQDNHWIQVLCKTTKTADGNPYFKIAKNSHL